MSDHGHKNHQIYITVRFIHFYILSPRKSRRQQVIAQDDHRTRISCVRRRAMYLSILLRPCLTLLIRLNHRRYIHRLSSGLFRLRTLPRTQKQHTILVCRMNSPLEGSPPEGNIVKFSFVEPGAYIASCYIRRLSSGLFRLKTLPRTKRQHTILVCRMNSPLEGSQPEENIVKFSFVEPGAYSALCLISQAIETSRKNKFGRAV